MMAVAGTIENRQSHKKIKALYSLGECVGDTAATEVW